MSSRQPNPQQVLRLHHLHEQTATCGHGQKRTLVQACAADLGVSVQTVYRWLGSCGFVRNERKRRADAGRSRVTGDQLNLIAGVISQSQRQNGKVLLTPGEAVDVLRSSDKLPRDFSASESNLRRLLMAAGMSPAQLARPTPSLRQRSLHPNHVHQVDASVCVAYYLSNATGLRVMDEREFYKNKPQNLTRIQDERLIRYVLTDHCSGAILPLYYTGSECARHLADFLIWCFSPKKELPIHGVPFVLQMDMGSANTSKAVLNMLDQLDVRYIIHERHNSRANGAVERAHNLVERKFEANLAFTRVEDLDDLNEKAIAWARDFGARSVQTRTGMTRFEKWMQIKPEELRLAPELAILRSLPTRTPEKRRIDNDLRISFSVPGHGQRRFDLRHLPGVMAGNTVQVRLNVLESPAVQVAYLCDETKVDKWLTIRPIETNEHGFEVGAPIIGEELRTGPRTLVDANREALLVAAFGGANQKEAERRKEKGALPYGGGIDAFKRNAEANIPAYIPRRGTPVMVSAQRAEPPRVSTVNVAKSAREALLRLRKVGETDSFGQSIYPWLQTHHPDGVPEPLAETYVSIFAEGRFPAAPSLVDRPADGAQAAAAGGA